MLVVMTYSGPLFLCIVLGLAGGHALFNAKALLKADDENGTGDGSGLVPEGITPCCQNDLGVVKITENGGNSTAQRTDDLISGVEAATGSKTTAPSCSEQGHVL